MSSDKRIGAWSVEDCGLCEPQYFSGRGTLPENLWDDVYIGVGSTPAEALDDACESAAISGWQFDGPEDEPSAAEEFGDEAERDYVAEARDDAEREYLSDLPGVEWRLTFVARCGMVTYSEEFDSEDEAREHMALLNFLAVERGTRVDPGPDEESATRWEHETESNAAGRMVTDEDGVLVLSSNEDEVESARERAEECFSDMYASEGPLYYVALYVRERVGDRRAWTLSESGLVSYDAADDEDARLVREDLQSLGGSTLECADGRLIYCYPASVDEARAELTDAGYDLTAEDR